MALQPQFYAWRPFWSAASPNRAENHTALKPKRSMLHYWGNWLYGTKTEEEIIQ